MSKERPMDVLFGWAKRVLADVTADLKDGDDLPPMMLMINEQGRPGVVDVSDLFACDEAMKRLGETLCAVFSDARPAAVLLVSSGYGVPLEKQMPGVSAKDNPHALEMVFLTAYAGGGAEGLESQVAVMTREGDGVGAKLGPWERKNIRTGGAYERNADMACAFDASRAAHKMCDEIGEQNTPVGGDGAYEPVPPWLMQGRRGDA